MAKAGSFFWVRSLCTVIGFLVAAEAALAAPSAYIGAQAGVVAPDAEDTTARLGLTVIGGAKLDGEWGFGGFFLTSAKKEDRGAAGDVDFKLNIYGIEGNYNFQGVADEAYAFARFGFTNITVDQTSYGPTALGLGAGYDIPVGAVAVNLEFVYYSVQEKQKSNGSTLNAFNLIGLFGGVKF